MLLSPSLSLLFSLSLSVWRLFPETQTDEKRTSRGWNARTTGYNADDFFQEKEGPVANVPRSISRRA